MSEATFSRARREAAEVAEAGRTSLTSVTVVAIRLIVNGWGLDSARCAEVSSHAVEYTRDDERWMIIWPEWNEPQRSYYLIDDGVSVLPMHVGGWHPATRAVDKLYISAFPVNVASDGTPRLRKDNGRPVDFSGWLLPASRAYHIKVRRDIPALNGQPY